MFQQSYFIHMFICQSASWDKKTNQKITSEPTTTMKFQGVKCMNEEVQVDKSRNQKVVTLLKMWLFSQVSS